jgi:hypothetical protein
VTKNHQKKTWAERALIIVAILVGSAIVIAGIAVFVAYRNQSSMELTQFTQCFASFDETFRRKDEFYKDEKRRCYGQRWSMPRAYFGHKYVSYHPITETVVIRVGHPGLTPGNLIPRGDFVRLFNEVNIRALWNGKFEDQVRHTKKTYDSFGVVKTNRIIYGMDIYDHTRMPADQGRDIFLFPPEEDPALFVKCLVRPHADVDVILSKALNGGCKVIANVDDHVLIEYYVHYPEMPNLAQINAQWVDLVRSFMVVKTN